MSDYISLEEVARIYGVHYETARRWVNKGQLKAEKIGRKWFIRRDKENLDENS